MACDALAGARERAIVNAMTVDVEEHFHVSAFEGVVARDCWDGFDSRVCSNTERLLALFAERGVTATFFVLGWVADRQRELVRRIASLGHEIASHGYAHRLIYDQTPREFRADVRRAKCTLEDVTGVRVRGFRAPSYSVTARSLWAVDVLIEEGHTYDASIFPVRHDRYGIPLSARHPYVLEREAGRLVEAPASTIQIGSVNLPIGGGGYFRILPYGWTRFGIHHLNSVEMKPAIFYLHPWEIDAKQPRLGASALSRFRHYRNLHRTEGRLRRMLGEFLFAPLATVLADIKDAEDAPSAALALPYVW